jgi:glycosyltransferase involved in cell wall biosynthesis
MRQGRYRFLFVSAPFGGIDVFFRNLQIVFGRRTDIDTSWVFLEHDPPEWFARVPPFSLDWTPKASLVASQRVRALRRAGGPFDAACFNSIVPASIAFRWQRKMPMGLWLDGTPTMLDGSTQWTNTARGRNKYVKALKRRLETNYIYKHAAFILPASEKVRRSLLDEYGVDGAKVKVLPNGIDSKFWDSRLREGRSGEDRPLNVLFVGGDFRRKGGDLLMKVAGRDEFRQCVFHFVTKEAIRGEGPNIRVYNNIGPNSTELRALYTDADIFALPTRADLHPVALCEAMMMGLPVVTTRVGGVDLAVKDSENGFVIEIDDEAMLVRCLGTLVESADIRHRFGLRSRKEAEENFDLETNARVILETMMDAADSYRGHMRG